MKRKALVVALLCVMGLATLSVGTAMAVQDSYTVTLSDVGSNFWGFYTFTATSTTVNPNFPAPVRFFIVQDAAPSPMQKASYAAALTAYSGSGKAIIYADPVTTACWEVRASN